MSDAVLNAKTMIAAAFAALNSGDMQKARDSFTRALFDIWRPELSREERVLVAAMLEAVSRFGPRHEWTE
jgi:hypothetical protein